MDDPNDNDNGETPQAVHAAAGLPQRITPLEALALAEAPLDPTPEELDLRQQAMGETRKSGPPLPPARDPGALALAADEEPIEPTEVDPPRPRDQ